MDDGMADSMVIGRNPVLEALKAGRPINRIFIARGAGEGSIRAIVARAREAGITISECDRKQLDRLAGGGGHQGVVAQAAAWAYSEVDELLETARGRGEDPLLLVLDGVEDPRNLGSLLRTCEAVGAHGVIIPERRSAGLTSVVAKASAGAIEHVKVARVTNLSRTVENLKEKGLWIAGADGEAKTLYCDADLSGPLALVLGSEGKGISPNLKKKCDFAVRLPMKGHLNSLNVSVAGAVILYERLRQVEPKIAELD